MSVISLIVQKLKMYPELDFVKDKSSISVTPSGGFTVWLTENDNNITVGFNGWHEEFTEQEEALDYFAFGLGSECRLKVYSRGTTEYKWVVQMLNDKKWFDGHETSLLFFPFWRKKQITYLQNGVIGN
jgi:hypothetical protein